MYRSEQSEDEYAIIKSADHIGRVWSALESNIQRYFNGMILIASGEELDVNDLDKAKVDPTMKSHLIKFFEDYIESYQNERVSYTEFFDYDLLDGSSPAIFKSDFKKKVHIIHKLVFSKRPEIGKWQIDFKGANPKELLEVSLNITSFADEYPGKHSEKVYTNYDSFKRLDLEDLESEPYIVRGVIGLGISSTFLYNKNARYFPLSLRRNLLALHFLSGGGIEVKKHSELFFDLPSHSSEFLMIDDRDSNDQSIDRNYWYPYSTFVFYQKRIFEKLVDMSDQLGIKLKPEFRYVYCEAFDDAIEQINSSVIDAIFTIGDDL